MVDFRSGIEVCDDQLDDPLEEAAVDVVTEALNRAREIFGCDYSIWEYIRTRQELAAPVFLSLKPLHNPLIVSGEKVIRDAIEKKWKLTTVLMYSLKYLESSKDDISHYYYFETVFSQPTEKYPIPQATASVYFRIQDKHIEPDETSGVPMMFFRLEGHHQEHDIRFVKLTPDWILGLIQMKLRLFKRIEDINLF